MEKDNVIVLHKKAVYAVIKCDKCNGISFGKVEKVIHHCKKCNGKEVTGKTTCDEVISAFGPIFLRLFPKHEEVFIVAQEPEFRDYQFIIRTLKENCFGLIFTESRGSMDMNRKYCNACAYCDNCVTCICGHTYERSKQKCPKCKKKECYPTYIQKKNFLKSGIGICPSCNSQLIKSTHYDSKLDMCPKCGSKDVKKRFDKSGYICKIERIPMLRKENNEGRN